VENYINLLLFDLRNGALATGSKPDGKAQFPGLLDFETWLNKTGKAKLYALFGAPMEVNQ
jgi:hypothetical protein